MILNSKADNIRALQEGYFGNAPLQWQTVMEVAEEYGIDKPIVVRSRQRMGKCWYDVTLATWVLDCVLWTGLDTTKYYFNKPIDKRTVTLNGEITKSINHLDLTYATVPNHMRPALARHAQHASGLRAEMVLRHFACDRGYERIKELLDQYPDHVIEFTCMSRPYGTLGWNTVVWEVRNY